MRLQFYAKNNAILHELLALAHAKSFFFFSCGFFSKAEFIPWTQLKEPAKQKGAFDSRAMAQMSYNDILIFLPAIVTHNSEEKTTRPL